VGLDAGQKLTSIGGKHPVAVALQPEGSGTGGADNPVGFETELVGGELGEGFSRKKKNTGNKEQNG